MSVLFASPEALSTASANLTNLGSVIQEAHTAAAGSTMQIASAAQDEISVAVSAAFGDYGQEFQALGARVSAFHGQFVQALSGGGLMYAAAEAANVAPL